MFGVMGGPAIGRPLMVIRKNQRIYICLCRRSQLLFSGDFVRCCDISALVHCSPCKIFVLRDYEGEDRDCDLRTKNNRKEIVERRVDM